MKKKFIFNTIFQKRMGFYTRPFSVFRPSFFHQNAQKFALLLGFSFPNFAKKVAYQIALCYNVTIV